MKQLFWFFAVLALPLGLRAASAGEAAFETRQQQAVAANPPGVSLTLRLPEGRTQFRQGEVIPLTAVFTSRLPDTYRLNTDPGSRDLQWGGDAFEVAPAAGADDPLRVYYARDFGMSYDGPGPRFQPLGPQPITIPFTLNEWLRFDAPGHYQVLLISRRIVDRAGQDRDTLFFQGRATASNAVDLDILPDDPAWDAQPLQAALPLFNSDGYDYQRQAAREAAVRTVRFLGTPHAARAMVARYGHFTEYDSENSSSYYQARLGLFAFPQPSLIIQEMQRRIADPDFPIFSFFLDDLAQTQFLAVYPQPVGPYMAGDPVREKERQAAVGARLQALTAFREHDRKELAAALSAKRGKARAVSGFTLLQMDYAHPDTAEHRALARALVPVFDDLTPEEQSNLLDDGYWQMIRSPSLLPLLRRLYAEPLPKADPNSAEGSEARGRHSLALRRLSELAPAEGRALLLDEIRSTHPRVDVETLCSLPDRVLPELDTVLASHLEKPDDWDVQSRLVERYATKAILPRVKAAYGDKGGQWACSFQSNLLAYFLRTAPAYGLQQMKKALAARKDTGCFRSVLSDVAVLAPGPDVERLAVAHLHDADPEVAADAAQTLGRYGSASAEGALWRRLREWHGQWQAKAAQVEPSEQHSAPVQGQLEWHLCDALALSPAWLADRAKLQKMESLCVTANERNNVRNYLRSWAAPLRISYGGEGDAWNVVQYSQLSTFAALETKLAQFPRGTRFLLSPVNFPDAQQQDGAYRRLLPFLQKRGLAVTKEAWPASAPAI